jgi:hypothetical protein
MISKEEALNICRTKQVDGVVTQHINEMIEVICYYIHVRKGVTINSIKYSGTTVLTPTKHGLFPMQDIQLILYLYETAAKWIIERDFIDSNSM